jgi:hypothetical protein
MYFDENRIQIENEAVPTPTRRQPRCGFFAAGIPGADALVRLGAFKNAGPMP